MATAPATEPTPPDPNSPVGEPPSATPPADDNVIGIEEALFGDTKTVADEIAARLSGEQPATEPPAAPGAPLEAGGAVGSAPATPPVTPPAEGPPSATPAALAPTEGTPPAPAATAPSATPAAAPTPPDERALREASLTAQVDALQRELEVLRGASSQPGQPPQPGTPESGQPSAPTEPLPRFNLTLPPELMDAIRSDDDQVAAKGLATLVNDLGTIVYHSVLRQSQAYTDQRFTNLITAAEQGQTEEARTQAREQGQAQYYEAFPDHKNPLIEPIIRVQAQQMAAEFPALQWGPDYINALGARVNDYIAKLAGGSAPLEEAPAAPNAGNPPPAKPAAMMPVGSRTTGAPGSEPEGSDLIVETLDVFS